MEDAHCFDIEYIVSVAVISIRLHAFRSMAGSCACSFRMTWSRQPEGVTLL